MERLRLKIIERLSKEGSSAEEPLNIPLSDYSSDEGNTSSSSSENEGKSAKLSDYEGPCCQPLKAPPCSPELGQLENRKNRKVKPKVKTSNLHKRSKKQHNRTPLDLPTTDPGSDIHFSTDDELYLSETIDGSYGTVPRSRKTLLQSELQRKYIESGGDQQRMPPELIVTPAKKKSSAKYLNLENNRNDNKFLGNLITEFPPISGGSGTRRTNSWHNLHKQCIPKIRIQNPNNLYNLENNAETLQFKLSLKKKIWTGVQPDSSCGDRNRPLSWGIPPIHHKKQDVKDEQDALLTACSQKLTAWQEHELGVNNNPQANVSRNKVTINLVVPEILQEKTRSMASSKSKKKISCGKLDNGVIKNSELTIDSKIKKKRNPLTKIAETTQLFTRIAKSKAKSSFSHQRKLSSSALSNMNGILQPPPSGNNLTLSPSFQRQGIKFKTGGIVATVHPNRKSKKYRSMPSMKIHEPDCDPASVTVEAVCSGKDKNFVKKVKNKIKKKKPKS